MKKIQKKTFCSYIIFLILFAVSFVLFFVHPLISILFALLIFFCFAFYIFRIKKTRRLLILVIFALAIVIIFGGVYLHLRPEKDKTLVDEIAEVETNEVLKKELTVTFDKIKSTNSIHSASFELKNLTKQAMWFNLELAVTDSFGRVQGTGVINLDFVSAGETVKDTVIFQMNDSSKKDYRNSKIVVTRAYSEILTVNDLEEVRKAEEDKNNISLDDENHEVKEEES